MTTPTFTLVKAGRLIDGRGDRPVENGAVLTEGSKIRAVGHASEVKVPEGATAEELDLPHATLLPGLIDCHTHTNMPGDGTSVDHVGEEEDDIHLLQGVRNARLALESGVTTMRDNGGWHRTVFSLKEGIRRELVSGPRIIASGRPVTVTGGHCWMMGSEADGVDAVRHAVRQLVKEGADFIKVMTTGGSTRGTMPERPSYSPQELKALVDEAHSLGRLVGAHANATQAISSCLDLGVDMIIHCTFLQPDGSILFDPSVGERIAASGAWVNPTLHVRRCRVEAIQRRQREVGLSPEEEDVLRVEVAGYEDRLEVCHRLRSAGARIIGGSDCGWYSYGFGQFHRELDSLTQAGFSASEAMVAGTRDAAEALGVLNEIGTLEPGKEADLLAVDGDPTRDVNALASVVAVFKSGARVR